MRQGKEVLREPSGEQGGRFRRWRACKQLLARDGRLGITARPAPSATGLRALTIALSDLSWMSARRPSGVAGRQGRQSGEIRFEPNSLRSWPIAHTKETKPPG